MLLDYDLKLLGKWSEDWLLKLNPNERKVLFFGNSKHVTTTGFFFQGCRLEFVSFHKYLRLLFSDDLKWSVYIYNIVSHAYKQVRINEKTYFAYQKYMSPL